MKAHKGFARNLACRADQYAAVHWRLTVAAPAIASEVAR